MKYKELRMKTNLNQTETAKKIGIPRVNYNKYELEQVEPDVKTLIKIADYFDVSLDYLCDRHWQNQVGYIPDDRKELVKQIIELETNDAKEVQAFINGLKAGKTQNPNFKVFN